jgi:hypothetical protein
VVIAWMLPDGTNTVAPKIGSGLPKPAVESVGASTVPVMVV